MRRPAPKLRYTTARTIRPRKGAPMRTLLRRRSRYLPLVVFALLPVAPGLAQAVPEGQMIWALHFSLAPTLFEPAETPGVVSPFMILYALHDALGKPMPGQFRALSLAETWSGTPDRRMEA